MGTLWEPGKKVKEMTKGFALNQNKSWTLRALMALLALAATLNATTRANADATNYASQRRQIRACVLVSNASKDIINPTSGPQNVTPHVFYLMDRRMDLKPGGWDFVNPLAPSTITPAMVARWQTRSATDTTANDSSIFYSGAQLTKNFGAYWEVNLDTVSSEDLQKFDVVLMAFRNNRIYFSAPERDKLRRFADAGGAIWIDDEGEGFDFNAQIGNPFLVNLNFDQNLSYDAKDRNILASAHHPIVNYPYTIGFADAQAVGAYGNSGRHMHGSADIVGLLTPVISRFVNGNGQKGPKPYVSAGDYGAGHIIITSGVAYGINNYVGGVNAGEGNNSGVLSGDNINGVQPVDLKLAFNMIAWTTSVPTSNGNTRRVSASNEFTGSQLGRKFQTVATGGSSNPGSGAVFHKGVIFYVGRNAPQPGQAATDNWLRAFDANPSGDLDGDLNPDDGLRDRALGTPYDEIWRDNLTGQGFGVAADEWVSTPTILSVYDRSGARPVSRDILTVMTSTGKTLAFDAFPRSNSGQLLSSSPVLWQVASDTSVDYRDSLQFNNLTLPMPSPAYSEGVLFTLVDIKVPNAPIDNWRVLPVNPVNGSSIFGSKPTYDIGNTCAPYPLAVANDPANAQLPGFTVPSGPLTVGYIRDTATGALEKMIYVPCRPLAGNDGKSVVYGQIFSVRDEPLIPLDGVSNTNFKANGNRSLWPWFAPPRGGPAFQNANQALFPTIRIVRRRIDGSFVSNEELSFVKGDFTVNYGDGGQVAPNRTLWVHLDTPRVSALNPRDEISVDYTLDWPDAPLLVTNGSPVPTTGELTRFSKDRRNYVYVLDPRNNEAYFTGAVALDPGTDSLIMNAAWTNNTQLPDRVYAMRDQNLGGGPESAWFRWMFAPHAGSLTANSGKFGTETVAPRIVNGDNFLPADTANPPAPDGFYAANFNIVGSPAVLNGIVYVVGTSVMRRPDSTSYTATVVFALNANPTMTFTLSGITLPITTDGTQLKQIDVIRSTIAPGQPQYVTLTEGTNFTLDHESGTVTIFNSRQGNGEMFNTALPIYVQVGGSAAPPVPLTDPTTGSADYRPINNLLWFMIIPNHNPGGGGQNRPNPLYSLLGSVVPASGPTVYGDALHFGTTDGRIASINLRGVKNGAQAGVYDNNSLRIHTQNTLTDGNGNGINQAISNPPLATTNTMAVGTPQGLSALENQITLIADNNRLLELDYGGNAVWSLDATRSATVVGGTIGAGVTDTGQTAVTKTPISRPNIARRSSLSEFIVADTGNNRVMQIDRGGNIVWELRSVTDDMHFLRPGDPTSLNQPTDVDTYLQFPDTGPLVVYNRDTKVTYSYTGPFYALHYIIADSGNYRAIEVVDAYGPDGQALTLAGSDGSTITMRRQVIFATRSLSEQNLRLRYRTIQQFYDAGSNATFMVAAIDNLRQSPLDPGTVAAGDNGSDATGPGGSIVVLRRYEPDNNGALTNSTRQGDTAAIISALVFKDNAGNVVKRQQVSNPSWFKRFEYADRTNPNNPQPSSRYILADDNGCYEIEPQGSDAVVVWALTTDDYYYLTGRRLRPASIQRLNQADYDAASNSFYPHYLITNRYVGEDNVPDVFGFPAAGRGDIHGEVFEIRGSDYYKTKDGNNLYNGYRQTAARLYRPAGVFLDRNQTGAITWLVPNETIPRNNVGVIVPGRIRRSIGSPDAATTTGLFDQPTFSDRPY